MNSFLRISAIAPLFVILFLPFIVSESLFFPFITGKNFLFRVLVEVSFFSWVLLMLRDASYRPRKSAILWSFLAFVAVVGVADIFGENAWKSFWSNFERMEGYITIFHLFMYFLAATSLFSERLWQRFLQTSLGASVLVSLYAIYQLAGFATINQGGVRVDATFGNATYLAIYLVFHVFFALMFTLKSRGLWPRLGYGAIAVLNAVILYHTATRGAILGLVGGLFVSAILIALFDRSDKRLRIIAGSAVGAVLIVILGFVALKDTSLVLGSPVLSRFTEVSWENTRSQARAYVWPMAIEGWKENPILGWGQENFNYVFNENYDPRMYAHEQWFDRTHNSFLDWLVAAGILGFLAYLSLYGSAIWLLWKRSPDLEFVEKAVLTGLGAAYMFNNLFVFDNLTSYVLFATVLGYIHFRATRLSKPLWVEKGEVDEQGLRTAGAAALIVLVASLYFFTWRGYATGTSLLTALQAANGSQNMALAASSMEKAFSYDTLGRSEVVERSIEMIAQVNGSSLPLEAKQKYYELVRAGLERQLERAPGDARYELFAGTLYSAYGLPQEAEAHYVAAHELSPRKQSILFQLGAFYIANGQYERAADVFKTAFDLEPSYDLAAKYYITTLIYMEKDAEARAAFAERFGNAPMTDDFFIRAYADRAAWPKVIELLSLRIRENPSDINSRTSLVGAYIAAGQRSAAIAEIENIIEINPSFKAEGERYIEEIRAGRNP